HYVNRRNLIRPSSTDLSTANQHSSPVNIQPWKPTSRFVPVIPSTARDLLLFAFSVAPHFNDRFNTARSTEEASRTSTAIATLPVVLSPRPLWGRGWRARSPFRCERP